MRTVLIADAGFIDREAPLLSRLAIGLADEGVRVIHAIPGGYAEHSSGFEQAGLTGRTVEYPAKVFAFASRAAARGLQRSILRELPAQDRRVDVVHAFGGRAWDVATHLAASLDAAVMLEFWRAGLGRRLRRLHVPSSTCLEIAVPDRSLAAAIREPQLANRVRFTPWGVHAPAELPTRDDAPRSIVLCCSGIARERVTSAFQAAAELARQHEGIGLFVDARAAERTGLWARGEALGVASRLTLVDSVESHRDLALRADVLMLPEALGEHRSFVLDAMARGVAVIAQRDPMVSALHSGDQVRLVDKGSVEQWGAALKGLIESPVERRTRTSVAREYVQQHHRVSSHIAAVLGVYEAVASGRADKAPEGSAA